MQVVSKMKMDESTVPFVAVSHIVRNVRAWGGAGLSMLRDWPELKEAAECTRRVSPKS